MRSPRSASGRARSASVSSRRAVAFNAVDFGYPEGERPRAGRTCRSAVDARRDAGAGRRERRGQVDGRQARSCASTTRTRDACRSTAPTLRELALNELRAQRRGAAAGDADLPRHDPREHRLRPPGATEPEIVAAATRRRRRRASSPALPEGYDTRVGHEGPPPVRRSAAAHRDRPGDGPRRADADPRRADNRAGREAARADHGAAAPADPGPGHHRHLAQPG